MGTPSTVKGEGGAVLRNQSRRGSAASCPLTSAPTHTSRRYVEMNTEEGQADTDCCLLKVLCFLVQITNGKLQ